jgi:hypothetical protein
LVAAGLLLVVVFLILIAIRCKREDELALPRIEVEGQAPHANLPSEDD